MFTQSADNDNENLKEEKHQSRISSTPPPPPPPPSIESETATTTIQRSQARREQHIHHSIELTKQTQTSSASSCQGYETSSSSSSTQSSSSSNFTHTNTTTSNKSSLSSPPALAPQPIQQPQPSALEFSIQSHEGSSLSSPSTNSPNSTDNLSFLGASKTDIIKNSDEQQHQQCSGHRTLAGSSDAHRLQLSAQIAQQRHHNHHQHHHNQSQSQPLEWQGNEATALINRVNRSNVNQGALFSNLDSTTTLAKPFQEELTTLRAAIRAMSWNSLRHDHLYRVRHNSYGGQDYYRHLHQQRRSHSQQQGMDDGFVQDDHATKMMRLDGSVSKQQLYPHYGGHSRARSIQQIRYQHQPIRLNSKDLKENHTDGSSNNDDKKEGKGSVPDQHLVKIISDLPVFVTIEDFRVASYTIAGEPHLCLPQLLQFLRQHFDTKTMVEKFEESLVHFPSATPKQVEGFIKSSCLPPSAKSCPLIKRSDADKICLSLFEELSNATDTRPPSDIVSLCSKQQYRNQEKHSDIPNKCDNTKEESNCAIGPPKKIESSEQSLVEDPKNPELETHQDVESNNSAPRSQSPENIVQQEKNTSVVVADYSDDKYATVKKKLKCNNDESDSAAKSDSSLTHDASEDNSRDDDDGERTERSESSRDKISPGSVSHADVKHQAQSGEKGLASGEASGAAMHDTLFDTEAQSSILNFARAVTSTLMIRVYHKCFGKCIGLFYPSLLKNKQLECIQCTTCKVMLTPRRFVGHTHGSKENDVCHWGFNSYNWSSYIRLSKKQPMNNLDEDELLHQFGTLTASANEQTDRQRPPATPMGQVPSEKSDISGQPCVANTSATLEPQNYRQNFIQSNNTSSPTRIAKSYRHQASGSHAVNAPSGESHQQQQPLTSSNSAPLGHNTSISMMRRFNTTDESSSFTLHAPQSISSLSAVPKLECNSQYLTRHSSVMDDRGSNSRLRSASMSGRMPSSTCCGGSSSGVGGGMLLPAPTRLTPQYSTNHYGLGGAMNHYPAQSLASTVGPGLYGQPDQLTGDLRNFLLNNWSSTSTGSHSQPPPTQPLTAVAAPRSSMLPLPPLSLPMGAGSQSCNPLPPMEAARPIRSNNEDLTKHLSLSAESKRELHVCTNLSTYLSRRGLSAGMTGDIVEKVLNLMRESRLLL